MTRPNNVTANYTYDKLSHLLSVLHQLSGSTIDGATYTLDSAGNRTAKTDQRANVTSNYGYDAIYELKSVTQGTNTTESYTYDPVGNRLSSLGVSPYSYNPSNELVSTPNAIYAYDSNGNLSSDTVSTGTTNYTWDFENRLTQATLPGTGGTVTFKYDPFGRRIQKAFTQNGTTTTTNYVYDGDNSVEEVNATGSVVARYADTLNIDEPLAESRSGTTSYYQADGLSSVTSLSTAAGALANTYTYDSFGKLTASTGTLTNPFQYTGRDYDAETGLRYYRTRYYDPASGRFISEDPVRFKGGINLYAYAVNNPLNLTDATGLAPGGGVGPAGCSYYDRHCKYSCNGSSSYECRAASCCRSFPDEPKANCTRECLIDWEIANCSTKSGSDRAGCRRLAHTVCYAKCKFFPDPTKLPASCWSIADGY